MTIGSESHQPAEDEDDWFKVAENCSLSLDVTSVAEKVAENSHWTDDFIVPKRVTIETIFGCNAKCGMCVIDHPTARPKQFMDMELFKRTVDSLVPYLNNIEMFDLFALGEPLIDPHIFDRIRYVKDKGFKRLAISTNANVMIADKQTKLLESGIDTVIFSIDGFNKKTHEEIRKRVNFDRVMEFVQNIIKLRDAGNFSTRFIIRFIRQDSNRNEWDDYKIFWQSKISPERNDLVTAYDMHTWAGRIASKDDVLNSDGRVEEIEREPCHHIFNNMMILANGAVALCSEDMLEGEFGFGNVRNQDPIEIFNSERFKKMRNLHLAGKKNVVETCSNCTLLYSEKQRSSD
jgi:sulfatase maturation enzyme AslB (radical SAM superfamily)